MKPAIQLRPVESSQIYSIGHDAATDTLAIQFKNKDGLPTSLYHYANVTPEDFSAFSGAESIGSHFYKHIKPANDNFPFTRQPDIGAEEVERIARACHEANREYCLTLGDNSQVAWEEAPEWQRESAMVGVRHALAGATPAQLHESWLKQKVADGWVYGDVKDADAKTHPCMLPYDELPGSQRLKDQIFQGTVLAQSV